MAITQAAFNEFIADLKATHKENLASVVLYGSAATGEFTANQSDYNVLIALNKITPDDLRAAQAPMREWKRLGHPLPVYFTASELHDAADVFPIEFRQMQKSRVVLFGEDPFVDMQISNDNLRHQTEYELRSKLLQLRRLYIPASINLEKLADLMTSSLSSFAALFRAVLMLNGDDAPKTKRETVQTTARRLKLNEKCFDKIYALREKDAPKLNETDAHELFADYLTQIERIIEFVDKIEHKLL